MGSKGAESGCLLFASHILVEFASEKITFPNPKPVWKRAESSYVVFTSILAVIVSYVACVHMCRMLS